MLFRCFGGVFFFWDLERGQGEEKKGIVFFFFFFGSVWRRRRRGGKEHEKKIKIKTKVPHLICSLSAASQSDVKPVRASETSAVSASLETLASSGLTCFFCLFWKKKRGGGGGGRKKKKKGKKDDVSEAYARKEKGKKWTTGMKKKNKTKNRHKRTSLNGSKTIPDSLSAAPAALRATDRRGGGEAEDLERREDPATMRVKRDGDDDDDDVDKDERLRHV